MERRQAALRLVGLGWFVGVSVGVGIWGGRQIDERLDTSPLMVIIGLVVGVIVAFYGVYRMILPNISKKQNMGSK